MPSPSDSYVTLSTEGEIGEFLLDRRPVFVLSGDVESLVWCNVAGAALWGAGDLDELRAIRLSAGDPTARLILQSVRRLEPGRPRREMLRFPPKLWRMVDCSVTRLAVAERTFIRVVVEEKTAGAKSRETAAADLAHVLAGDGAAAVLTLDGRVLGSSGGFHEIDGQELRSRLGVGGGAIMRGDRRWRYRSVTVADGGGPVVLVLAELEAAGVEAAVSPAPEPAPVEMTPERVEDMTASEIVATEPETPISAAEEPDATRGAAPDSLREAEEAKPVLPEPEERTKTGPADEPEPVRFHFQIGADGRFTSVSPEFTSVVGNGPSDLVGKTFADIEERLSLEDTGALKFALTHQEGWSGITLYWPVEGKHERVAVDLAALPAFGRERTFEGFRGFGICRPSDRRPGPVRPRPEDDESEAEPVRLAASGGSAAVQTAPLPAPSNVVRLPGASERRQILSAPEQDAFQRIAEVLGSSFSAKERADAAGISASEAGTAVPGPQEAGRQDEPLIEGRVLDRLGLGILIVQDQEVLFANKCFLEILGYSGTPEFVAAGGIETLFVGDGSWREGEERRSLTARGARGTSVPVDVRLQRISVADGSALMVTLSDRAAQISAEASVNESREALAAARTRISELEGILDTATDGVVVVDAEGRILSFNRSAEALFDIEAAEAIGTPFVDLLAEESRKAALDYVDGLARNGVVSVLNDGREVIGKVPERGLIPLFMTMGRLGDTNQFCAVLRDMTHWKKAEEELVTARRAAEAANQQKSEFLAKISHEIRTPLNAIIGFSEVMMEERFGPVGNDRYKEYLRDIHVSGAHLMSLINDLLDLSKIEAGKIELSFDAVAVNSVVQECVALMQPQANRERIIIRTSLAPGIPNVVADPRSLRQIILNLLSNAVKFTLPGGQVIVSSNLEENGEVVLRIRDTGVGMSEKDIEAAMKPFRQLATSGRERFDGTGLGLPLTKAMVEANRATFSIDSAVDQGTMVRIAFPPPRVLAG